MAGYASLADVYAQLLITPGGEDDPIVQRVGRLNESLSRVFDQKVGMTWSEEPVTASTKTIEVSLGETLNVPWWGGIAWRLPLPVPVRSITAIEAGGTWNGTTWVDGEAVAAAGWRLGYPADKFGNVWEILLGSVVMGTTWPWLWPGAPYRITAIWGDNPGDAVPAEVRDALTWLVVHHYREETASPAGQIGPEGLIIPTRNPWNFERVTTVIERYKLVPPLAV